MRARLAACAVLAALLTGCAPAAAPGDGLQVLAAETFLADIAQNVAGSRLKVDSLLPPGVDPHGFQVTPRDAIRIAQADVVIVNGQGYETWLQKSLAAAGAEAWIVEASAGLQAGPKGDPHLWMNPRNAAHYVENIRVALSELDPGGSEDYAANADAYLAKLRGLDAWISEQAAGLPLERRVLVTNHDALESFAQAYGFEVAGVVIPGATSEAAPSAQQMSALIQSIRSRGIPAIFLDVSENPTLAAQIAAESGVRVVSGLYIETLSGADGPAPTYLDMMRYDVGLIMDALRGTP